MRTLPLARQALAFICVFECQPLATSQHWVVSGRLSSFHEPSLLIRPPGGAAYTHSHRPESTCPAANAGAGEYVCELCSVKVSGARNMSQHLSSARHLRRAATAARGIAAAAVSAHDGGAGAHPGVAGQVPLQGAPMAAAGPVQPTGDYCQQVKPSTYA